MWHITSHWHQNWTSDESLAPEGLAQNALESPKSQILSKMQTPEDSKQGLGNHNYWEHQNITCDNAAHTEWTLRADSSEWSRLNLYETWASPPKPQFVDDQCCGKQCFGDHWRPHEKRNVISVRSEAHWLRHLAISNPDTQPISSWAPAKHPFLKQAVFLRICMYLIYCIVYDTWCTCFNRSSPLAGRLITIWQEFRVSTKFVKHRYFST